MPRNFDRTNRAIKERRSILVGRTPNLDELAEGEKRYALISGTLYLYVKAGGGVYRFTASRVT